MLTGCYRKFCAATDSVVSLLQWRHLGLLLVQHIKLYELAAELLEHPHAVLGDLDGIFSGNFQFAFIRQAFDCELYALFHEHLQHKLSGIFAYLNHDIEGLSATGQRTSHERTENASAVS